MSETQSRPAVPVNKPLWRIYLVFLVAVIGRAVLRLVRGPAAKTGDLPSVASGL